MRQIVDRFLVVVTQLAIVGILLVRLVGWHEVVGPDRGLRWDQVLAPGTLAGSAVSREAT